MIRQVILMAVFFLGACSNDEPISWVDEQYARDLANFADNADVLLQRGLLADRKHRYIDLLAHANGIDSEVGVRQFLASKGSQSAGAFATAEIGAAELQLALEHIGLSAGHPIDAEKLLYWPKGDRLTITVSWDGNGNGRLDDVISAERLIVDRNRGSALPQLGFRYVGPKNGAQTATELVTIFNSQATLLEVAYTVNYKSVENSLRSNPAYTFVPGQPLRIRLRPEARGERVRDYWLYVATGSDGEQLSELSAELHAIDSEEVIAGGFEDVYVALEKRIAEGEEPFIEFRFSDAMPVASVRDVARFARQFLIEQQIRIEPSDAEPYFSAFLPDDVWRDPKRRGRSSQPLEIHLSGSELSGELFQRSDDLIRIEFANVNELEEALSSGGPWDTDGVFVFVVPGTAYSQIRAVYSLVGEQFRNFYVFQ